MRWHRIVGLVVLIFAAAAVLRAADISGKWTAENDQGPQWVFNFKVDGNALTGTMQGAEGKDRAIKDGKIEGDALSFSVDSEWQGQSITLMMKGKVSGEKIDLRVDTADGSWGTDIELERAAKQGKP
jgi:hypothetical protein